MTQHPYDEFQAFSLGLLAPANAELVLDHADHCPTCAVLLAEAVQGVAALEMDTPPRAYLPRSYAPALARLRGGRVWSTIAALATAAAVALFVRNVQLQSSVSALSPPPVAALVHSHFAHHPLFGAPGAGAAKAIVAADGSWVYVVADQLAPGTKFDVWETLAGRRVLLGSLNSSSSGEATAYFKMAAAKADGFALVRSGKDPSADPSALRWP